MSCVRNIWRFLSWARYCLQDFLVDPGSPAHCLEIHPEADEAESGGWNHNSQGVMLVSTPPCDSKLHEVESIWIDIG